MRDPSEKLGGARRSKALTHPSAELLKQPALSAKRAESGESSWQNRPVCPLPPHTLWGGGLRGPDLTLAGTCLKKRLPGGSLVIPRWTMQGAGLECPKAPCPTGQPYHTGLQTPVL